MALFGNNNINFQLSDTILSDLENNNININNFYWSILTQNNETKKYIKDFLNQIYETELMMSNMEKIMNISPCHPGLQNNIKLMISYIDTNFY